MMIIRLLIKSVLILIVLMAIGSYLIYLKTGKLWVPSLSTATKNIRLPSFMESDPTDSLKPIEAPKTPTYKWLQNGSWHYGDQPPKGVKAIAIHSP